MSLERMFYTLENAELQTAAFYEKAASDTGLRMPRLSDLFYGMAAEERVHARQIELLQEIFTASSDSFSAVPGAQELVLGFMNRLELVESKYRAGYTELGENELVAMAMSLETELVEVHRTFFFHVENEQLKRLFDSLNLADQAHLKRLQDYAAGL